MTESFRERCYRDLERLQHAQKNLRAAQADVLADCIARGMGTAFGNAHGFSSTWGADEFRANVPVRDYNSFAIWTGTYLQPTAAALSGAWIDRLCVGEQRILTIDEPTAFYRTSGTTGKSKAIPSTPHWRGQYRGPAIYAQWATYHSQFPALFDRDATMDLTWDRRLPAEFIAGRPYIAITHRSHAENADDWLPPWFDAPWFSLETETNDFDCRLYIRLRHFITRSLRAIVTINPSMLVLIAHRLEDAGPQLIKDVHDGTTLGKAATKPDPATARRLEQIEREHGTLIPSAVWPTLKMLACWRSAGAKLYREQLDVLYPGNLAMPFMTTGTEGVVTIPTDMHPTSSLLAANQGFYEFSDYIDAPITGEREVKTLLAHELERDRDYQLIMTQANGLYRYAVGDIYRVLEVEDGVPRLEFMRRAGNVFSFTGEKLTEVDVIEAFQGSLNDAGLNSGLFTVVPVWATPPYYVFFTELRLDAGLEQLAGSIDNRLRQLNEEYNAKRVSSRVDSAKLALVEPGTFQAVRDALATAQQGSSLQMKHAIVQRSDLALRLFVARSRRWSDEAARREYLDPSTPRTKRHSTVPPRATG